MILLWHVLPDAQGVVRGAPSTGCGAGLSGFVRTREDVLLVGGELRSVAGFVAHRATFCEDGVHLVDRTVCL